VARGDIPDNVQALVADCLSSITQLDLLLLLHSSPDRAFAPDEVGRDLHIPDRFVRGQLVELAAAGVVTASEDEPLTFRFDRQGPRARDVDALADAVARRKRAVHNLILAGPSDDVQLFSDAFRLRKKEKD
jgi:hypothetical protein